MSSIVQQKKPDVLDKDDEEGEFDFICENSKFTGVKGPGEPSFLSEHLPVEYESKSKKDDQEK